MAGPVCFSALAIWLAALAPASALDLPSGTAARPVDILWEAEGGDPALVLRWQMPAIARGTGGPGYDALLADFDLLCAEVALPILRATGGGPDRVVVVLMDRNVPRGVADPEATQFLSEYRVADGRCILEDF